jgi:hypothetical protein
MLKQILGGRFTEFTGCYNDTEFWSRMSGLSSGTALDHMVHTLGNLGHTGTPKDRLRSYLSVLGTSTGSEYDNANAFFGGYPVGMTFFKDYTRASTLYADYSVGSPVSTFTATRGATAPATYVDSNGVIQLVTTSDIPRYQGGYYDATGFHAQKGLMVEAAGTNIMTDGICYSDAGAGLASGWTRVNTNSASNPNLQELVDVKATFNVGAVVNAQHISGTEAAAVGTGTWSYYNTAATTGFAQNDKVSISAYIKGSLVGCTIKFIMFEYNVAHTYLAQTVSNITTPDSSYKLQTATVTVANASTAEIKVGIQIVSLGVGDTYDLYYTCFQAEKSPYPTSFIPTTTAALTRGAEVLTYPISGNRTAETETIFVKFAPSTDFANDGVPRQLIATSTKDRRISKNSTATVLNFYPNTNDSSGTNAVGTTNILSNTSYVVTGVAYGATASTNARIYVNGISEGTDADDYTSPAWGTNFYIGSNSTSASQLNGTIQKVAIYNRALSDAEVLTVSTLLNL